MLRDRVDVPAAPASVLGRWLATIVVVASAMAAFSVALDLTADDHRGLVGVLAGAGLVVGWALHRFGDRIPAWSYPVLLVPAIMVQLAVGIGLSGEADNPASTFFLIGGLYSAYFFRRRVAAAHLLVMAVAFGGALLAMGAPLTAAVDRWSFVVVAAVLISGVVAALRDQLVERAAADPLTGVLNRRAFEARLAVELGRGAASRSPLSVLCVDVDRFKAINDRDGHHAGDAVLRALADALRLAARGDGRVGRLGGDEFAVLLPGASATGAVRCADEVRRRLADVATISVGVAAAPEHGTHAEPLLMAADAALYAAKDAGRDRVALAGDEGVRAARVVAQAAA